MRMLWMIWKIAETQSPRIYYIHPRVLGPLWLVRTHHCAWLEKERTWSTYNENENAEKNRSNGRLVFLRLLVNKNRCDPAVPHLGPCWSNLRFRHTASHRYILTVFLALYTHPLLWWHLSFFKLRYVTTQRSNFPYNDTGLPAVPMGVASGRAYYSRLHYFI